MPTAAPSFHPTPYPSPGCPYGTKLFSVDFYPSGEAWNNVTASVYLGTYNPGERDPAAVGVVQ